MYKIQRIFSNFSRDVVESLLYPINLKGTSRFVCSGFLRFPTPSVFLFYFATVLIYHIVKLPPNGINVQNVQPRQLCIGNVKYIQQMLDKQFYLNLKSYDYFNSEQFLNYL